MNTPFLNRVLATSRRSRRPGKGTKVLGPVSRVHSPPLQAGALRFVETVKELYEPEHEPINSADILKVKNIKQNHANDLLRQGHTAGFLSRTKKGRENYYSPTNKKLDVIDVSSIEFTELDLQKWYKENFDDSKYELV